MTERTPLSATEWTVMNALWRRGVGTAAEVQDESPELQSRDVRTVKTLLVRIAAKGWIESEHVGRAVRFRPLVSRRAARLEAIRVFVDNVLDRSVAPLYLHLVERDELSEEEAEVIRRRIEELEAEDGEGSGRSS